MSETPSVRVRIDPAVSARHPEVLVGWFGAAALARVAAALDTGADHGREVEAALRGDGLTEATLAEDPRIRAWRDATRAAGLKAATFRSSAEQLARRLLKSQAISTPLPLVTVSCLVSARHLAPLAVYDHDRLPSSTIDLRPARPGQDRFEPLGARAEDMPLSERVIVYAAGDEILCWNLNYRDSRVTSLRPETERALVIGEAVAAIQHASLQTALDEMQALLVRHGATVGPIAYRPGAG